MLRSLAIARSLGPLLAALLAACSVPPFRESLEGGLTLLDADRYAEARAHFESARAAAAGEDNQLLAQALLVECWIGEGARSEAEQLLAELLATRPRSFVSWKCATAFYLRFAQWNEAARAALAASSASETPSERAWADQSQSLIGAWVAFYGGDPRETLRALEGIDHAELSAASSYLHARAQRLEQELAIRARRAAERGAHEAPPPLDAALSTALPLRRSLEAQRSVPLDGMFAIEPVGIAANGARALLAQPGPRLRVSLEHRRLP